MPRVIFLLALICAIPFDVISQFGPDQAGPPKLEPVPPSPQAADLGRYGQFPIGHQTGTPNISIPIYTIQLNDFSYPISLTYHCMGNKVDEVASNVGLGWTMQATGSISTAVRSPDQYAFPPDTFSIPPPPSLALGDNIDACIYMVTDPPPEYEAIKLWQEHYQSFEYNPYFFNFAGFSGKFIRYYSMENNVDEAAIIPYQNLRIIFGDTAIVAIDENGVKYIFDHYETSSLEQECTPSELIAYYASTNESAFLSKIITPNGNEIVFTYEAEGYAYTHSRAQDMLIPYENNNNCEGGIELNRLRECVNTMNVVGLRLLKIEASNGQKVEFKYSDRADLPGAGKIDSVEVYNNTEDPIKIFKLFNSYAGGIPTGAPTDELNFKLKLDAVQEFSGSERFPPYKFEYNSSMPLPRVYGYQDCFGYSNGSSAIMYPNSILPNQPSIGYSGGVSRIPDLVGAVAGLLIKMTYPTGGYSQFEYEAVGRGGGRIKSITNYSEQNKISLRRKFKYPGTPITNPSVTFSGYEADFIRTTTLFYPYANVDLVDIDTENLCYYWKLTSTNQNTDVFNNPERQYGYVEEFLEDANGVPNGKVSYTYGPQYEISPASLLYDPVINHYPGIYLTELSFLAEPLGDKTEWKLVDPGTMTWHPVKKTEYLYEVPGVNEVTLKNFKLDLLEVEQYHVSSQVWGAYCRPANYQIRRYQYLSTMYRLKEETETIFEDSIPKLIATTEYLEYDSISSKPTHIRSVNSDGSTSLTYSKYPPAFEGLAVYDSMILKNMVGTPVVVRTTVDSLVTNEMVNQFEAVNSSYKLVATHNLDHGNTQYYHNTLSMPDDPSDLDPLKYRAVASDIQYDASGNLDRYKTTDAKHILFKWGYENQYFIARCETHDSLDFYTNSFEESGTSPGSGALTGDRAQSGGSFTVPFSPADTSKYAMSYWYYSGSKWNFSGVLPFDPDISESASYLDEVRVFPKKSLVTTYTYQYGKGVTSVCDPNNAIMYYEYDDAGRLKYIRDEKKNIVKSFSYTFRN